MKKSYSNIKSISSNFPNNLTKDRCLICNNKLDYNNYNKRKILAIHTHKPTVSTICKRCGAIHIAKYEMEHDEESRYTKVFVKNGKMNIKVFSRYSDEIVSEYNLYCQDIDATIPDKEEEEL